MQNELSELIELLIEEKPDAQGKTFLNKIQSILETIPNIGTTTKKEFFTYFFLGGFLALPYSDLKTKLNIKNIFVKKISPKTFRIAFQQIKKNKKYLKLYVFTTIDKIGENIDWQASELQQLNEELKIKEQIPDNVINKIFHITSKNEKGKIIKYISETRGKDINFNFKNDLKSIQNNKKYNKELIKIEKKIQNFRLEDFFETITQQSFLVQEETKQKKTIKNFFYNLSKIYQQHSKSLYKTEAASHGFTFGVFRLVANYRYGTNIVVELNAGKGREDMSFVVRKLGNNLKGWQSPTYLIEFKSGKETPQIALDQINDKGYLYFEMGLRTMSDVAFAIGVNFEDRNQAGVVKVEKKLFNKTYTLNKLILDLFNNKKITTDDDLNNYAQKLQNDIEYSVVMANTQDKFKFKALLLLGQAATCNSKLNVSYKLDEAKKELELLIQEKLTSDSKIKNYSLKLSLNSDKKTTSIKISAVENSASSNSINNLSILENDLIINTELENLLSEFAQWIEGEVDVQAIMLGGLKNAFGENAQIFMEKNHNEAGRADIIAIPKHHKNSFLPKIIELKFALDEQDGIAKHKQGVQQVHNYKKNFKIFTEASNVVLSTYTYYVKQTIEGQRSTLFHNQAWSPISHSSASVAGSERIMNSPNYPSPKKKSPFVRPVLSPIKENNNVMVKSPEIKRRKIVIELPHCSPGPSHRTRREAQGSCLAFDVKEEESVKEMLKTLHEFEAEKEIALAADEFALLIILSFPNKSKNISGRYIIMSDKSEDLAIMQSIIDLVYVHKELNPWLYEIKRLFPREGLFLEAYQTFIDFKALKNFLLEKKLRCVFIKYEMFQKILNGNNKKIAAIYSGNQIIPEQWLHAVYQNNPDVRLDRKSLFESGVFESYRGEKNYLLKINQQWNQVFDNLRIKFINTLQKGLSLAENFAQAIAFSLHNAGMKSKDWLPILESANYLENRKKMRFLNVETQMTQDIEINNIQSIINYRDFLYHLYKKIRPYVAFNGEKRKIQWTLPNESIDGIDGLNAMFVVETLLNWSRQKERDHSASATKDDHPNLAKCLEMHRYVYITQMIHTTLNDISHIVNIFKTLLKSEEIAIQSTFSALNAGIKSFNEGFGVVLGGANVVLDIVELNYAKTEIEKAIYTTALTFDVASLALSGAGIGASVMGATTAGAFLGAVAVPITGIGIGMTGFLQAEGRVLVRVQAVGIFASQLKNAYFEGYQKKNVSDVLMMVPMHAVVKEINFDKKILSFGATYFYKSKSKATTGGVDNYIFWVGNFPRIDLNKNTAFDIGEALHCSKHITLSSDFNTVKYLILPDMPESYIRYGWQILPFLTGRHDTGFEELRHIEKNKLGDFFFDFYIFPSEYGMVDLHPEFIHTNITVTLDDKERIIILPKFDKKQKIVADHLHYILKSPLHRNTTAIQLNPVGSLHLNNRQKGHSWIFTSNSDIDKNSIQFIKNGFKIQGLPITIDKPEEGHYYLQNDLGRIKLDPIQQMFFQETLSYSDIQNKTTIKSYIINHSNKIANHSIVQLNNYPLSDNYNEIYNGTAYFSIKDGRYYYTQALPIKSMQIALKNTPLQINFIGCLNKNCYFWANTDELWSSHFSTHKLINRYYFKEEITSAFIKNNKIYIETKIETYETELSEKKYESYATYFIKPEGSFYLGAISDKNNYLFHQFENDYGNILPSNSLTEILEKKSGFFHPRHEDFNKEDDRWDGLPVIFPSYHDNYIAVLPLSPNKTSVPLWLHIQAEKQSVELINPKIAEQLILLGSVPLKNGSKAFFYYQPADFTELAQNHFGKVFLQQNPKYPAQLLELPAINAFMYENYIVVVTPDFLIKAVDGTGQIFLHAMDARWTHNHQFNWQATVPKIIKENNSTKILNIYGLQDREGNALGAWYDAEISSYIFMKPPKNAHGQQFSVNYLASYAQKSFFFCPDNGILYQGIIPLENITTYFNATRLIKGDLSVAPFIHSVKNVVFRERKWQIETLSGEHFSSKLLLTSKWNLEKIGKNCYDKCKATYTSLYRDYGIQSNNIDYLAKSLLNLSAVFARDCIRQENKRLYPTYNNEDFCSINNFNKTIITDRFPCIVTYQLPILIESGSAHNLWWSSSENEYFINRDKNENAEQWTYLGWCKQTIEQNFYGICFFAQEENAIFYASRGYHSTTNKTRIPITFAKVIPDRDTFLLSIHINDFINTNLYFFPLIKNIKILSLSISNTNTNDDLVFKVPQELLSFYEQIFYSQFQSPALTLSFPPPNNINPLRKVGNDIVLISVNSKFDCKWTFSDALSQTENNSLNQTRIYIENYNPDFNLWKLFGLSSNVNYNKTLEEIKNQFILDDLPQSKRNKRSLLSIESLTAPTNIAFSVKPVFLLSFLPIIFFNRNELGRLVSAISLISLVQAQTQATKHHSVQVQGCTADNPIFSAQHCQKHASFIGLLYACQNSQGQSVALFENNRQQVRWWASIQSSSKPVSNVSTTSNHIIILRQNSSGNIYQHRITKQDILPVDLLNLWNKLPEEGQSAFLTDWQQAKNNELNWQILYQQFAITMIQCQINNLLLFSPLGDVLAKTLQINWREKDHVYLTRRLLTCLQQCARAGELNAIIFKALPAFLEILLLSKPIQQALSFAKKRAYPRIQTTILKNPNQLVRYALDYQQFGFQWTCYMHAVSGVTATLNYFAYKLNIHSLQPVLASMAMGIQLYISICGVSEENSFYIKNIPFGLCLCLLPFLFETCYAGIHSIEVVKTFIKKIEIWLTRYWLFNIFAVETDSNRLEEKNRQIEHASKWFKTASNSFFKPSTHFEKSSHENTNENSNSRNNTSYFYG